MKVGLIGLGRMGEGMSRRMMAEETSKFMVTEEMSQRHKKQQRTGILLQLQILWKALFK